MKFIKLQFGIVLLILFQSHLGYCQKRDDIQITGTIDTSIINKYHITELRANLFPSFIQDCEALSQAKTVPISKMGAFSLTFKNISVDMAYIGFTLMNVGNIKNIPREVPLRGKWMTLHRSEVYPIEPGDSINVHVQKDNYVQFTGKGFTKLECQENLLNCSAVNTDIESHRFHILQNTLSPQNLRMASKLEINWMDLQLKMGKVILDTYAEQLSKKEYQRFYLDLISATYFEKMYSLSWAYNFALSEITVPENKYFLAEFLRKDLTQGIDSNAMVESAYYADLLYQLELNKLTINDRNKTDDYGRLRPANYTFQMLFETLKNNYSGKLRDKLITIAFENSGKKQIEAKLFITEAITVVKDAYFNDCLVKWQQQNSQTYPFKLRGLKGNEYTLKDFKGKLLVLDFWFNGCPHCVELNAFMRPAFEHYKNNPNILFLSVNVDKDPEVWKKGIETKLYTSPEEMLLNIGEFGFKDPFLLAYDYDSYPQLMVIGKHGDLVTSNAPKPWQKIKPWEKLKRNAHGEISINLNEVLDHPGTKDFFKLIDEQLQKK